MGTVTAQQGCTRTGMWSFHATYLRTPVMSHCTITGAKCFVGLRVLLPRRLVTQKRLLRGEADFGHHLWVKSLHSGSGPKSGLNAARFWPRTQGGRPLSRAAFEPGPLAPPRSPMPWRSPSVRSMRAQLCMWRARSVSASIRRIRRRELSGSSGRQPP